MAEQKFVDWDGLVYYDSKVKTYISDKLEGCIKVGGEVTFSNLPRPSYKNLNYVYKILDGFTSNTDFEIPYLVYKPGCFVQVADFNNDSTYRYVVLYEPIDAVTQDQIKDFVTAEDVDEKIYNAQFGDAEDVLSNYYTKEEVEGLIPTVPTKVSELENDANYLTEHIDVSGKLDVDVYKADKETFALKSDIPDVSNLITTDELDENLSGRGYITEQDLEGYAKTSDIPDVSNFITEEDVPNYIPESYVTADELAAELEKIEHPTVDLTDYYTAEETDNLLTDYVQVESYDIDQQMVNNALNNRYNKEDADKRFALKADLNALAETVGAIEVPTQVSKLSNDAGYITLAEVPKTDLSNYYNKTETENLVADAINGINIPEVDLTGYYTKEEVNGLIPDTSKFIESIPDEYITADELAAEGFIKEHQDLSSYALKSEIPTDYLKEIPAEYITETDLESKGYLTEHQDISGKADKASTLSGYGITDAYTRTEIDTKLLEIESGGKIDEESLKGFVSEDEWNERIGAYALKTDIPTDYLKEVPDEYITETELNAKGYLTEHQDLSNYALRSEIPDVSKFITAEEIPNYIPNEYVTEDELTTLATKEELVAVQTTAGQNSVKLFQIDSDLVDINAKLDTIPTKVSSLENDAGYATEEFVSNAISNLDIPEVDLTDYYTKEEVNELVPSLDGYAKTTDIPNVDNFITMSDVEGQGYLTSIPAEYITEEELAGKGYITDISGKADTDHKHTLEDITDYVAPSFAGYATETYVEEKIAEIPLSDYALKSEIPSVNGLASETWVEAQGYLKEHQSLEDYYNKSEVDALIPSTEGFIKMEDVEAKGYITDVSDKADVEHTHSYNDLTDKPTIPNIDGLATTEYVDGMLATKSDAVLFTEDMRVTSPIGLFTADQSVMGLSVRELFINLLGLKLYEEPSTPEVPETSEEIVEDIIERQLPMYQVNESGETVEVSYTYVPMTEEAAAQAPTEDCFYQITNESGDVIESGYQHLSAENDSMYYVVALPKGMDFGSNVTVQFWDSGNNIWVDPPIEMSCDEDFINSAFGEAEIPVPEIDKTQYTLWIDASLETCAGTDYRFIIK